MTNYREQLRELQQKAYQKGHLENLVADLEKQYEDLKGKVFLYEAQMKQEQADVDKLEGRSLAAFFAGLRGNKEERLSKEQQEARAARVKYDMALLERNAVEDDLRRRKEELADLETIPAQREAILAQWAQAVKAMGGPAGRDILALEERMAYLEGQRREISEAQAAGKAALEQMDSVLASLKDAEEWGIWDALGGGFGITMLKYDALDEAQGKVEGLQLALRRFKTEMLDISMDADEVDLDFVLDDVTQFGDYFFDNFFTDWVAQQRINDAQIQAMVTRDFIQETLDDLTQMDSQHQADLEQAAKDMEALLTQIENGG